MRKKNTKPESDPAVDVQRVVRRLELRVIAAARASAAMITKAHDGDESNIPDENALVEAVEALDKAKGKTPNAAGEPQPTCDSRKP